GFVNKRIAAVEADIERIARNRSPITAAVCNRPMRNTQPASRSVVPAGTSLPPLDPGDRMTNGKVAMAATKNRHPTRTMGSKPCNSRILPATKLDPMRKVETTSVGTNPLVRPPIECSPLGISQLQDHQLSVLGWAVPCVGRSRMDDHHLAAGLVRLH